MILIFFHCEKYCFFQDGLTPLHCSARSGHEMVVDLLLERGAPKSSTTKVGNSIMCWIDYLPCSAAFNSATI